MRYKKIILVAGAASIAFGCAGTPASVDAATKSNQAPKYSNPKPFTTKEKQQGAEVHPQILQEFGGAYQSPQTAYVTRVGKGIAVQSGLSNAEGDFTVTLLNSAVNNAFAIPGGYIYITRQLVGLCNSEAEMAGVLGHEVGHTSARHSEKRQKRATLLNVLGTIATVGGAAIGDNGGLAGVIGGGLKEYSGVAAQLFTLSYSRGQEEESDDLGIRYLSKAGYDPLALSDMLTSLALQTSIDARIAGKAGQAIPEWASTHPDPAKRVSRAAKNAKAYPANSNRRQDTHFAAINGMMYDDDPAQGVIDGQNFRHRDLRLKFTAPTGFGMQNTQQAVMVSGNSGQAMFTTAAYSGNKSVYMDAAFKAVVGKDQTVDYGNIQQTTVNGIPAFYASTVVNTQQGQRRLTVFAYEFSGNQAFHFVTVTASDAAVFDPMFASVARLSSSEASAIKARKIKIVTVGRNDTIASLSNQMAYGDLKVDRFLALNGLRSNATLAAGKKVKIVTY